MYQSIKPSISSGFFHVRPSATPRHIIWGCGAASFAEGNRLYLKQTLCKESTHTLPVVETEQHHRMVLELLSPADHLPAQVVTFGYGH
jgi:hypothetical protein